MMESFEDKDNEESYIDNIIEPNIKYPQSFYSDFSNWACRAFTVYSDIDTHAGHIIKYHER